jgi:hypothetical protein
MTNLPVTKIDSKDETSIPHPALKINRTDLINTVIGEVASERMKKLSEARRNAHEACQAFIKAVAEEAMIIAKPVIEALKKVSGIDRNYFPSFSWRPGYNHGYDREFKPQGPILSVQISNHSSDNRSASNTFYVDVTVTPRMAKLREAAFAAVKIEGEVSSEHANATRSGLRAEAQHKILRQAIENMPGGSDVIKMLKGLYHQAERNELHKQLPE